MTTERKRIAVVGATSQQGASVINAMLDCTEQWIVRGISRDPTLPYGQEFSRRGVEMVKCDINNLEECCRAFVDTYGVLAITNRFDAGDKEEYEQAVNMIEAARTTNVQHLVFSLFPDTTIFEKEQQNVPSHSVIENSVENYIHQLPGDSTFPYTTYIRVGFFYQSLLTFFLPNAITPEFRYPNFFSARIPFYDVRDTGKVVRECFSHPERFGHGQIIPIISEHLTIEEICTQFQAITYNDVKFVPLTYEEALRKYHRYIFNVMQWHHNFHNHDEKLKEIAKEIHPNMKTFTQWFQEVIQTTRW